MKLKQVLALIPAILCGLRASAIEQIDGVYQISSAEDMTAFAELVNGGGNTAQAVLTADIDWTSGSTMLEAFAGVLDGQGHSLKMNLESSEDYSAFIRSLAGTVENLVLEGKFTLSGLFGAGFAGQTWEGAVLRNCVSKIDFDVREAGFGSYIGTTNAPIFIENCVTAGTIKVLPEVTAFGGFIGSTGPATYILLRRCLMLADVERASVSGQWGTYIFSRYIGTCENCYYTSAFAEQANGATLVEKEQVTSGGLCWQLNQGLETPAFYQTLDADAVPYPVAEGHKPVYISAHANCGGQLIEVFGYNNEKEDIRQDEHTMENGTCTVCGYSDPNYFSPNENGFYEIDNAQKLYWFISLATDEPGAKALLTADIDFSEHNTMLGGKTPFSGVLDGQGHTITVKITGGEDGANYVAFVRELDGGTLENLVLEGEVASASLFAGGIVGHTMNRAVLRNVVSRIKLSQIGDGGVAGFGGFVGHVQDGLIENCIFAGSIHTVGNSTSGVTGWADNLEMHNCAVIADIEVGDLAECYAGARGANVVQDNFYYKTPLSGSPFPATQVTDEQIQSGELCCLLGGNFRQNLGEDAHPVPDKTHGIVTKIGTTGYATLYLPETGMIVPNGVKAYAGIIDTPRVNISPLGGNYIPAATPVILQGEAGFYSFKPFSIAGAASEIENELKGTAEPLAATGTQYVLAEKDGQVGFYKAEGTIPAGKAYIEYAGAGVKAFFFGDATGLSQTHSQGEGETATVYDLSGRRVEKPGKGIYIVNGKLRTMK